jgi:hypothetical protein
LIGDHIRLGLLFSWTITRWPMEMQKVAPLLELFRVIAVTGPGAGWLAQLPPVVGVASGPPGVIDTLAVGPGVARLELWPLGLGLGGPAPACGLAAFEAHPAAVSSAAASTVTRSTGLVGMPHLLPSCGRGG